MGELVPKVLSDVFGNSSNFVEVVLVKWMKNRGRLYGFHTSFLDKF